MKSLLKNNTMTPEQQRITIAEACGWKLTDIDLTYPTGLKIAFHPPDYVKDVFLKNSPNYLTDLNAMHEAEKVKIIGTEYESDYCMYLYENAHQCFATAAQRAEAFLRTLNLYIP